MIKQYYIGLHRDMHLNNTFVSSNKFKYVIKEHHGKYCMPK
jgi:hypothetical protein